MIASLLNSDKFKEDYKNLQKRIADIPEKSIQDELFDHLKKLKENVGFIDRGHEQMLISGKISSEISDIREKISFHRKTLEQRLSHFEKKR
jgi:hypothetical protein